MKHQNMRYEDRYRYKLNMLEPGLIMTKFIGAFFAAGLLFRAIGWQWLSSVALFLSGAIFAVLMILVAIEAHQDRVLNAIALRENNEQARK